MLSRRAASSGANAPQRVPRHRRWTWPQRRPAATGWLPAWPAARAPRGPRAAACAHRRTTDSRRCEARAAAPLPAPPRRPARPRRSSAGAPGTRSRTAWGSMRSAPMVPSQARSADARSDRPASWAARAAMSFAQRAKTSSVSICMWRTSSAVMRLPPWIISRMRAARCGTSQSAEISQGYSGPITRLLDETMKPSGGLKTRGSSSKSR